MDREGLKRLIDSNREYKIPVERCIFAMVANRALSPASKRGAAKWVNEKEVWIDGVEEIELQNLYRSMDFLLASQEQIQKEVFFEVANLLNLEVDLMCFDTTSTYFEVEEEDEEDDESENIRRNGNSKDHRPDLPQVVIGLAVTRDGIPVRSWCWPGNTADMSVVEEVKKDLMGWKLGRVITVLDRGFNSEENLRYLQRGGRHYIAGEKMRSGKEDVEEALSKRGLFKTVNSKVEIKKVIIGEGEGL